MLLPRLWQSSPGARTTLVRSEDLLVLINVRDVCISIAYPEEKFLQILGLLLG